MQIIFHIHGDPVLVLGLDLEAKKAWPVYESHPVSGSLALAVADRNYQGLQDRLNYFQGSQGIDLKDLVAAIKRDGDIRSDFQYYLGATVLDQDMEFPIKTNNE